MMKFLAGLFSAIVFTACQTTANAALEQAVLKSADQESLAVLKAILAKAVNRPTIELGAGDLTQSSIVSVLPKRSAVPAGAPQNQVGNFSLPIRFTLMMAGKNCYALKDGSEEKIMLDGVKCRPALQP